MGDKCALAVKMDGERNIPKGDKGMVCSFALTASCKNDIVANVICEGDE